MSSTEHVSDRGSTALNNLSTDFHTVRGNRTMRTGEFSTATSRLDSQATQRSLGASQDTSRFGNNGSATSSQAGGSTSNLPAGYTNGYAGSVGTAESMQFSRNGGQPPNFY